MLKQYIWTNNLKNTDGLIPTKTTRQLFKKINLLGDVSRLTVLSTVARHAKFQKHSRIAVGLLGEAGAYHVLESIGGYGGARPETSLSAMQELAKAGQYSAVVHAIFSNSSPQARLGGMKLLQGHIDQGLLLELDAAFESINPKISAHMMDELLANGYRSLIVKIFTSMGKPGEVENFLDKIAMYASSTMSHGHYTELKQIAAEAKGKPGQ